MKKKIEKLSLEKQPIITITIIIMNVLISLILFIKVGGNGDSYTSLLYDNFAVVSPMIKEGELWRFVTAVFMHFDIKHLANNMFALYVYGLFLEEKEGRVKMLFIYLTSGIFGNVVSFAFGSQFNAGASGAIFGLLGTLTAEIIQLTFSKDKNMRDSAKKLWGIAIFLPLVYIIPGFFMGRVNNISHISGVLAGVVGSFVFDKDEYLYKRYLSRVGVTALILTTIIMIIIGFSN